MEPRFCSRCGAVLPVSAQFCPKCGEPVEPRLETIPAYVPPAPAPVAPAPAAPAPLPPAAPAAPPPARSRSGLVIGVIAAMIAVAILIWLLLMGLPFGRRETARRTPTPRVDTIVEAPPPPVNTATLVEEAPVPTPTPVPAPVPRAAPPAAPARSTEISQSDAVATLGSHLQATRPYDVAADCIDITPREYANRGYTLEVIDRCGARTLGRWRVDSVTREVFRRREDGRYLRP